MAKISFVNEVKNLTTKDPWKQATVRAMMITQKLIQVLQVRNSTSELRANLYKASSNTINGPVTPGEYIIYCVLVHTKMIQSYLSHILSNYIDINTK